MAYGNEETATTGAEWSAMRAAALASFDDATLARMTDRAYREAARCAVEYATARDARVRPSQSAEHRATVAILRDGMDSADNHWRGLRDEIERRAALARS